MLTINMDKLPAAVAEEFARGRLAKETLTLFKAPEEQARIARQNAVDHRSLDGLGRLRLSISSTAFHYWGRRLGYDCWRNEQFLREFERDNPACRVKCGGTRTQVGYTGDRAVRFRKTYADAA